MADDLQMSVIERVDRAIQDRWCSAAAAVVMQQGRTLARYGAGTLAWVGDDGEPLDSPEAADATTWFDLASVTKVFTAITAGVLVERGTLGLDEPIGTHLPTFATPLEDEAAGRGEVSLRHLLSHTSGLPAIWEGWLDHIGAAREAGPDQLREWPLDNRDALLQDLLTLPLQYPAGQGWEYSCVGYNTVMALAEAATGEPWHELVQRLTLEPMGLAESISWTPPGPTAATEVEAPLGRGVVQGIVHDEAAWSLGGAGNAGLFGTVDGVARLGELIRVDALPCSNQPLVTNVLPQILGRELANPDTDPWGHSLGLRIGQRNWMADGDSVGHTGFTGTSVQVNLERELTIAVLTNRVHPTRQAEDPHRLRREVAELALAGL